jgi:hypothetical protein
MRIILSLVLIALTHSANAQDIELPVGVFQGLKREGCNMDGSYCQYDACQVEVAREGTELVVRGFHWNNVSFDPWVEDLTIIREIPTEQAEGYHYEALAERKVRHGAGDYLFHILFKLRTDGSLERARMSWIFDDGDCVFEP